MKLDGGKNILRDYKNKSLLTLTGEEGTNEITSYSKILES